MYDIKRLPLNFVWDDWWRVSFIWWKMITWSWPNIDSFNINYGCYHVDSICVFISKLIMDLCNLAYWIRTCIINFDISIIILDFVIIYSKYHVYFIKPYFKIGNRLSSTLCLFYKTKVWTRWQITLCSLLEQNLNKLY